MSFNTTAALLGKYRSKVSAIGMSANTGSVDIMTIAHQLGTIPDKVVAVVRSVVNTASSGVPNVAVVSIDASQATVYLAPSPVATNIILDVFCELDHSIIR